MILRREAKKFSMKNNRKDTFFARLPEYARLYAIPYALSKQGLQKYGRQGSIHQLALQKVNSFDKIKYRNVITVFIGGSTSIAAIKNGKPIEVSNGFSPIGGILSETGCGEIDSAIIFQLLADGVSGGEIERLLSKQSGFKALAGGRFRLTNILGRRNLKEQFAKEVFCYQILKHIGAYAASLGGLDLILFIGKDRIEIKNLIFDLMIQLKFLGIKRDAKVSRRETSLLTAKDSLIKAYFVKYDKQESLRNF